MKYRWAIWAMETMIGFWVTHDFHVSLCFTGCDLQNLKIINRNATIEITEQTKPWSLKFFNLINE